MENSKAIASVRDFTYTGKHPLLPPKSPFPSIPPSYSDYTPNPAIGSKIFSKSRDGKAIHQRTSSESVLIEEQPSWLEELLNEPDTPVRKAGHRRSSSDSFAYLDSGNISSNALMLQDEYNYRNVAPNSSWASQDVDIFQDAQSISKFPATNYYRNQDRRSWEFDYNKMTYSNISASVMENAAMQKSRSTNAIRESKSVPSIITGRPGRMESGTPDPKSSEMKENSYFKSSESDSDVKRAKQQFAQRSRVRKLQYIAELERNVHTFQEEGSEMAAEFEFVNQQNIILSMENQALKQRLESLTQEHLIKCLEHEVLEREIGRLRTLYHHQHQSSSNHRRKSSRDIDSQFANLSLKQNDTNSGHESVPGTLRI